MKKIIKIEELCKLYASLNSDYIRLGVNNISYSSPIAKEQNERLDKIWNIIFKNLTNN